MTKGLIQSNPVDSPAALWLIVGFLLLPFTMVQTVIPLAAWLAPVFVLRFARQTRRACTALLLIFLAYAAALFIALRGSDASNINVYVFGMITGPLLRGILYTLPSAADRLLSPRLGSARRVLIFPLAFTALDWLMSLSPIINSTASPPTRNMTIWPCCRCFPSRACGA
jgi:apolipoprotein N-acyltransferase